MTEEQIHVLNNLVNNSSIINDITNSKIQENGFYVCDIGEIVQKHELWRRSLPRVDPFYAVKCNESLPILKTLAALNIGFDCDSKFEIDKILELGVDCSSIIFTNPTKPISHIRHAASKNVAIMTFDNEDELYKIQKFYPKSKLLIRINFDILQEVNEECQDVRIKFGCDYIHEAPELLRLARDLDLNVIGVSFDIKSGCKDLLIYDKAICYARKVFEFGDNVGYNFNMLDIGGGFPGGKEESIDVFAVVINAALQKYFSDSDVKVIARPGKYFVESAYWLTCIIHSVKRIKHANENYEKHNMYYVDDGIYGSFNCRMIHCQKNIPISLKDNSNHQLISSSIWGPTHDNLDQVCENVPLPRLNIGDWIVFRDMGAYTLIVPSSFNGFSTPKVFIFANETVWLLLKDLPPFSKQDFVSGMETLNLNTRP